MKKFKKIAAIGCAAMMVVSSMSMSVFAASDNVLKVGDKVDYTVAISEKVDDEFIVRNATNDEKIDLMTKNNRTPGSEFNIGTSKYIVADDYNLIYNGVDITASADYLRENVARGINIPTSEGNLPYRGTYNFSTYIYTSKYFIAGEKGMSSPGIGIDISATNYQKIVADWIDGRNNQSMGASSTITINAGSAYTLYNWVYAGEKFYVKFVNKGSTNPQGSFSMYVDQ